MWFIYASNENAVKIRLPIQSHFDPLVPLLAHAPLIIPLRSPLQSSEYIVDRPLL